MPVQDTPPRFRLGPFTATRIAESAGAVRLPGVTFPDWTPDATAANRSWLMPDFLDGTTGHYTTSIRAWLIQAPGLVLLWDAGGCAGKERPANPRYRRRPGSLADSLDRAGVAPDAVDVVAVSHLHVDHVGGTTRRDRDGTWVPAFPRARYLLPWRDLDLRRPGNPDGDDAARIEADSIEPLFAAGCADTYDGTFAVRPGVTIEPASGHSPGHSVLRLSWDGGGALFTADVLHHPMQVLHPGWNTRFCEHPAQARTTRRRVLTEAAEHGLALFPAHFGPPHAARVVRDGAGFLPRFLHPEP